MATTTFTYDEAYRLTDLSHDKGTTNLADYSWTFDTAGRITSVTNLDGTDDYTYDDTGQLTAVDSDYQTDESYSYDANGNRTLAGYTTGDNNQLTSDGTWDYEYDDEGNRTKKTHGTTGDYVEYTWDHRNRLTAVTFRDSSDVKTKEVTYVYDVYDRRIAKDVDDNGNGTIDRGERYVYDSAGKLDPNVGVPLDDVVLVYDRSDNLVERLLHGPGIDQPLASEDSTGDVLWLLADNQGTIRDVAEYDATTDTTTVVNHLNFDGFGNITAQSDSTNEPRHTYTGREWDADAELFYYRARWYDPQVGRFLSEDPIGFNGDSSNLVRYVGNSPLNYVDPTGLVGEDWLFEYAAGQLVRIIVPRVGAFEGRAMIIEALRATGRRNTAEAVYDIIRAMQTQAAAEASIVAEETAATTTATTTAARAGAYGVIAAEVIIVGYEVYLIEHYWDEVEEANQDFLDSRTRFLMERGLTQAAAEQTAIDENEQVEDTLPGYWDTFQQMYLDW